MSGKIKCILQILCSNMLHNQDGFIGLALRIPGDYPALENREHTEFNLIDNSIPVQKR